MIHDYTIEAKTHYCQQNKRVQLFRPRNFGLESPIFLDDLRNHRVIKTSSFVRSNMQGNLHATEYWPYLYEMIVKRNPGVSAMLARYAPERLG